jgi:hypothetical protein
VALDAAVSRAETAARPASLAGLAALPVNAVLAAIVALSFGVRWLLAFAHSTPLYFADEYIYSTLAYELAHTGRPTIRGESANFPALLEPVLTAPAWLPGDPALALRLTQGLNALAMSLAAVPVYLLARRLRLGKWLSIACAAFALVVPDLFYVSFILGEPIAYPLVLAALCAGVYALAQPTRRNQVAFAAFSALATFARVQFVILPVAFVLAAIVVERGSPRRILGGFRLSLGLFAAPVVAALAFGPGRALGYYRDIADFSLDPVQLARWLATDGMLLAYAAGWVLVPAAVVALALGLVRPRDRTERAFAALAAFFAGGILLEAALYAVNSLEGPGGRFQERYLLTLLPLVPLLFGVWFRRGAPGRHAVALIALGLLVVSARVPLSAYTSSEGRQDSPFLMGVYRLEHSLGFDNGSLLVAAAAALLAVAAAGFAYRPRRAPLALGLAACCLVLASAGAFALDHLNATRARETYLPADARWVDRAGLGETTFVHTPGTPRPVALEQLFWNRSVTKLVRLRRADPVDVFSAPQLHIARDGTLLLRGRPLRTPLLVSRYAVDADLVNATRVDGTNLLDLWRPDGTPRLSLLAGGRYYDGWLADRGWIRVWPSRGPRVRGVLRLRLRLPASARPTRLSVRAPGFRRSVLVRPDGNALLSVPVSSRGPWTIHFRTVKGGAYLTDGRPVSVLSSPPLFVRAGSGETLAACALRASNLV